MSARNYLSSARDKNKLDTLPSIKQKFAYRSSQDLPPLSANTNTILNRNLSYKYDIQPYILNQDQVDRTRTVTPFSDFFSESEIGTPDIRSEESDSSTGSALRQSTAEAARALIVEWERIERTLYDEPGEKCTRPALVEECNQWMQLHPQLRIVGKALLLPEKKPGFRAIEYDEVIAMHYSDYDQFSESEERLSQSSNDVTPQNSPRPSVVDFSPGKRSRVSISEEYEPKLSREKVSFFPTHEKSHDLPDKFCSLLHISPLTIRSPPQKKRPPSILRSEIASSKWMRGRPDSSTQGGRNSAKSVSLDSRNLALSASDRNKIYNNRVLTAKHRDLARLQPLYSPDTTQHDINPYLTSSSHPYSVRKVSLPPLLLEEEKRKVSAVGSAKKHKARKHSFPKSGYNLDKIRSNYRLT